MTKQELASYCSSLISIMESKEDGGIDRGRTIGREYDRAYAQLMEIVRKEEKDELDQNSRSAERDRKDSSVAKA